MLWERTKSLIKNQETNWSATPKSVWKSHWHYCTKPCPEGHTQDGNVKNTTFVFCFIIIIFNSSRQSMPWLGTKGAQGYQVVVSVASNFANTNSVGWSFPRYMSAPGLTLLQLKELSLSQQWGWSGGYCTSDKYPHKLTMPSLALQTVFSLH